MERISVEPWQIMWLLAFAIYAVLKGLTFIQRPAASFPRQIAYLFAWPGMNVQDFLTGYAETPPLREWIFATVKFLSGMGLIWWASNLESPLLVGWIGMFGLIFTLHFGLFHLLSAFWRSRHINAEPIMHWPVIANSLSDFWGKRWNMAFRDLAFGYIFRPLVRSLGVVWATMLVFLASGLIHDLVISWPVHTGYGGPTFYFTVQGLGLLMERKIKNPLIKRTFCGLVLIGPLPLLFHRAFVTEIIVPTIRIITWT